MATSATASVREWRASSNLASPLGSLETRATIARFAPGDLIYLNGEPADFWYRILSGACRRCAYGIGGSRRIVDFLRPGDLFGYESQSVHSFSAEAIVTSTTVARYPRRTAEQVADSDPQLARRIRELAFLSVLRGQRRQLIDKRIVHLRIAKLIPRYGCNPRSCQIQASPEYRRCGKSPTHIPGCLSRQRDTQPKEPAI